MRREAIVLLIIAVVLVGFGFGAAWWMFKPVPVIETTNPAETQPDGSTVIERKPDAKAKPKQQTPKGAKVERVIEIVAQGVTPPEIAACTSVRCPPVKVDLSLVRLPDNTKRVLASSPDGQIVGAVDIPVETAAPPPEPPKWAVGISIDPLKQTPGVWVHRDIWRVRVTGEINQTRQKIGGPSAVEGRIGVGVTF